MALQAVTLRYIHDAVYHLASFKRGNIRAERSARGDWVSCGQLPEGWRHDLKTIGPTQVFVIYSYDTPIAWTKITRITTADERVWTVPRVRYSASTTNHQNAVRRYLADLDAVISNDRPVPRAVGS